MADYSCALSINPIFNYDGKGIRKYSHGFAEGDTVLLKVEGSFSRIPSELHA